jgi:fumarylpyruvate hydrolase
MELVVAIKCGGANIPAANALGHVFGYAAGLELKCHDMQDEAKATRRPCQSPVATG